MTKLPPIDLKDFLTLLKDEGRGELQVACGSKFGSMTLLREWDNILVALDSIVSELAKGAEIKKIIGQVQTLGKSAAALSALASQVLSFVPGPVGMVCSFINAIVCFCTLPFPVNLGNGMLELLGCVPGGKVAGKLAPKVEQILMKAIGESPDLCKLLKDGEKIANHVKVFAEKAKNKMPKINGKIQNVYTEAATQSKTVGRKLDIDETVYYRGKYPSNLMFERQQIIQRYRIMPRPETNMGNPYANVYSHLWK